MRCGLTSSAARFLASDSSMHTDCSAGSLCSGLMPYLELGNPCPQTSPNLNTIKCGRHGQGELCSKCMRSANKCVYAGTFVSAR